MPQLLQVFQFQVHTLPVVQGCCCDYFFAAIATGVLRSIICVPHFQQHSSCVLFSSAPFGTKGATRDSLSSRLLEVRVWT